MNSLLAIQRKLKVGKSQFNSFGKYRYRNCEDILEALKPLLEEYDARLIVSDEVETSGNFTFVKATASIKIGQEEYKASAFAKLDEAKKGMDGAQATGSATSYARKYALGGLFLIDDAKDDPDAQEPPRPATLAPGYGSTAAPPPPPPPPMANHYQPNITAMPGMVPRMK